jgi:hypothetical protein
VLSQSPDLAGFPESNVLYLVAGDLDVRRFGPGRSRRPNTLIRLLNRGGFQFGQSRQIRFRMRHFLRAIGRRELIQRMPRSLMRIDEIYSAFAEIMDCAAGGRRWIEKSPQNVFVLDMITRYFPHAQFVHVIRDERDNIASLRDAGLRHGSFSRRFGGPAGLARAVAYWNRALLASAAWRGHANHVFLRYEDLCADPEAIARPLCGFLEISFHPGMLTYRTEGIVKAREVWKVSSAELRRPPSKFGIVFSPEEQAYVIANSLKADALFPRLLP